MVALSGAVALTACKKEETESTATPPAAGENPGANLPDEGPLPKLRTGVNEPTLLPQIELKLDATVVDGARYYELTLPDAGTGHRPLRVHIEHPARAIAAMDHTREGALLVRVPASVPATTEVRGTAYFRGDRGSDHHSSAQPFVTTGPATSLTATELPSRWGEALARQMRGGQNSWMVGNQNHPWREFAAGRVLTMLAGRHTSPGASAPVTRRPRRTELAELMHTTTAATSMQEALQHDRGLRLRGEDGPPTIALATLTPPALEDHPWDTMTAALPDPAAGTPEPLAAVTPAEFWYLRFDDIRVMLQALDEAEAWITPVAHIMEERAEVRALSKRYQRQLGLRRSGLAKTLGHTVVQRLAVMGSDPYLREGSDVTIVFQLHNQTIFDNELSGHMASYREEIEGIASSTITHGTHTITVLRDPTGAVRQHRAQVDDMAIVSNSPGAIRAVLDAVDGRRRRLSDEKDLAYMLARDPGEHDAFAFLSDRFIANVVGPAQKVMATRRQRALSELLTPGYAALLYGWLEGRAPSDTETLVAAGLLYPDEMRHSDGATIRFTPGDTARSSWGSPSALTPLIDLPAPDLVTEAERDGYDEFTRGYQEYWRQFMDPIAVRLDIETGGDHTEATVDVRVLPLISGTDYADIEEIVGTERIEVPAIGDGVQAVWAVGAESGVRRDLDRTATMLSGKADIGLGWLGGWVMLGTLDRRALVDTIAMFDDDVQLPAPEPEEGTDEDVLVARQVGKLPVYAAAQVSNPMALVSTLTAIRATVNEVSPGMVHWGEHSRHGEYAIVRVGIDPKAPGSFGDMSDALALYYVQAGDAFIAALQPAVLETLIDRIESGQAPRKGVADGPQMVIEAQLAEGHASWTAAAWALQGQANRNQASSRLAAEILLRGDPGITTSEQLIERGLDYFGTYPVTASGRTDFALGPHGVSDPVHGSQIAPAFPELPVDDSPIAALMSRLTGVRATVAFDREPAKMDPPARSLHTRLHVRLGDTD